MKKFFLLTAILLLTFIACEQPSEGDSSRLPFGSAFEVSRQPLSTDLQPAEFTQFNIRYTPGGTIIQQHGEFNFGTIIINNIKDLVFTISGSREYQIGDTGPGSGIIFFVQGGQYKEVSGELGTYNWDSANTIARAYQGGGYSDWRLPDRGELNYTYENLHLKGLGGFTSSPYGASRYWTSEQPSNNSSTAYYQEFSSGNQSNGDKGNTYRVRAVRTFSLN